MKKNFKRWLLASGLFGLLLTLSGCVQTYKSGPKLGEPTGDGIIYKYLVAPMGSLIEYFVTLFDGNYGLAIILFTLIIRGILLPLGLHQTRKATYQSEKMLYLKPQMDAVQAKSKAAVTQEEQLAANQELQALYKENGMSMFGGIGCLPLLIQMPIFTALFFTIKYMPGINESTFLGINLGEPNMILVVLAGISYFVQSMISMIGIPEEQKKQMRTMMFMSPLMIVFISLKSPAGVTLYWVIGGLVSCIQTVISNFIQKPRIKEEVAEEFRLNPPKQVVTPVVTPKPATVAATTNNKAPKNMTNTSKDQQSGSGRNAGRQQKR